MHYVATKSSAVFLCTFLWKSAKPSAARWHPFPILPTQILQKALRWIYACMYCTILESNRDFRRVDSRWCWEILSDLEALRNAVCQRRFLALLFWSSKFLPKPLMLKIKWRHSSENQCWCAVRFIVLSYCRNSYSKDFSKYDYNPGGVLVRSSCYLQVCKRNRSNDGDSSFCLSPLCIQPRAQMWMATFVKEDRASMVPLNGSPCRRR